MPENHDLVIPLPWQQNSWEFLTRRLLNNTLAHALLINSPDGCGKTLFAQALIQLMLCTQPKHDSACGHCRGCQLYTAQNHPDLLTVTPEVEGKAIKIEQIRQINHFVEQTAYYQGRKIIFIAPAEAMNIASANALLKCLEEPTNNTYFILVTNTLSRLPLTIRSRSQVIQFDMVKDALCVWLRARVGGDVAVESLLEITSNAPLKALALLHGGAWEKFEQFQQDLLDLSCRNRDPIALAHKWSSYNVAELIHWSLVSAVQKSRSSMQKQWFQLYDRLLQVRRDNFSKVSLNAVAVLEDLFCVWQTSTKIE